MVMTAPKACRKALVGLGLAGSLLVGFAAVPAAARQISCPATTAHCTLSVNGGNARGHTVAVVGDSITYMSGLYIESSLRGDGYRIDATSGYTMALMYPAIQQLLPTSPAAWVVELGTNDARFGTPSWSADFSKEVNALASQRCVVLVSVNPRLGSIAVSLDQAIASTVAGQSNFHELDWGDIEWQHPRWVAPDGIHPGPQGSAELAKLMRLTVRNVC
jgi:hypothetical protein